MAILMMALTLFMQVVSFPFNSQLTVPGITSSPAMSTSPNGQFLAPRLGRPEDEQVLGQLSNPANQQSSSPTIGGEPTYLSPRHGGSYQQSRAAARFHSIRSGGPTMMLSPAAYSPYAHSQFSGSTPTFGTPIGSPLNSEFHDGETMAYFSNSQLTASSQESLPSGYASPMMLQHSMNDVPSEYYHSPMVSPPITPMEPHSGFAQQMSHPIKFEFDHRSGEYPMSPYTPTYGSQQHLPLPTSDPSSRRPVSAGRLMAQRDMYGGHAPTSTPLKRSSSFNSSRFAKSLSPPRSGSSSSPPGATKRPTYSKWSPEEDDMLRTAISIHGTSKWSLVASMVKGRTAMQCSTRWQGALNTTIHKGKWEPDEDAILVAAVEKWRAEHPPHSPSYDSDSDDDDQSEQIPWGQIAAMLPRRRTGIQCQARWSEALDPTVRKGKWTQEEDDMLFMGVSEFGQCWIKVASKVKGRTQRQIRTRWMQIRGRDKNTNRA